MVLQMVNVDFILGVLAPHIVAVAARHVQSSLHIELTLAFPFAFFNFLFPLTQMHFVHRGVRVDLHCFFLVDVPRFDVVRRAKGALGLLNGSGGLDCVIELLNAEMTDVILATSEFQDLAEISEANRAEVLEFVMRAFSWLLVSPNDLSEVQRRLNHNQGLSFLGSFNRVEVVLEENPIEVSLAKWIRVDNIEGFLRQSGNWMRVLGL